MTTTSVAMMRRKQMTLDDWTTTALKKRTNDDKEMKANGVAKRCRRDLLALAAKTRTAPPLILFDDDNDSDDKGDREDRGSDGGDDEDDRDDVETGGDGMDGHENNKDDINSVLNKGVSVWNMMDNNKSSSSDASTFDFENNNDCALLDRKKEDDAHESVVFADESLPTNVSLSTDCIAITTPLSATTTVGWGPASLLLVKNAEQGVERAIGWRSTASDADNLSSNNNCGGSAEQSKERLDVVDQANDDDSADQAEDDSAKQAKDESAEQAKDDERSEQANVDRWWLGDPKEATATTTTTLLSTAAQDDARLLALLARRASTVQRACEHAVRVVRRQQRHRERQCALDDIRRALDLLTHTARPMLP